MNTHTNVNLTKLSQQALSTLQRQICLPTALRGLTEAVMFAGVFVAASKISLGISWANMFWPLVLVVAIMMFSMIVSGVYRRDITNSILNIYLHSAYGFFIATLLFLFSIALFMPAYANGKFVFFYLFFAFFVMNTVRPLISGTDFMDGGGRRTN